MSARSRYTALMVGRTSVLDRAREASRLTIPGLIPEDGQDNHTIHSQPYQSLGARGTNNLAAKVLMTTLPPDTSFLRLELDEDTAAEMGAKMGEVRTKLARITNKAKLLSESSKARPVVMEAFRHLIIAGNVLLYHPADGSTPRMWRLDQYVVSRDERGELMEAVIKEMVLPSTLSVDVRAATQVDIKKSTQDGGERPIEVYTHITRRGTNILHHQEINDVRVPGSEGQAPTEQSGWQALRWQAIPGSDYGRAFITEYIGDLLSLEDITKSILQFAAEASRIVRILDPNSGIDAEELAEAESGDVLTGYVDRIGTLQLDKMQDFKVALEVANILERRLSQAFLLATNTIRDAERVTAEEIRAVAQELEDALGGTYTVISTEFQLPYAKRLLYILQRNGEAPKLPPSIRPTIVTGFEALGRNHSTNKLRAWLTDVANTLGPEAISRRVDEAEVMLRFGTGHGVDGLEDLIKSDDEVAAEQQQAQLTQAAMSAAPNIAKGAMDQFNQEGE